jgi:hypothetical protein
MQLVNTRFRLSLTDNPIGELVLLHHEGSVDDFAKRFMALSCHDPDIMEVQVQLFIVGLGKPLHTDIALQWPAALNDAIMFAYAYEQRDVAATTAPSLARHSGHQTFHSSALAALTPAGVGSMMLLIAWLGKSLRIDVALQRPVTLNDTFMFARAYEQCDVAATTAPSSVQYSGRQTCRSSAPTAGTPTGVGSMTLLAASLASIAKPSSSVKRLTVAEIADHCKDGQCFHCNKPFTNRHKLVC